jgi:hypothetical protein
MMAKKIALKIQKIKIQLTMIAKRRFLKKLKTAIKLMARTKITTQKTATEKTPIIKIIQMMPHTKT